MEHYVPILIFTLVAVSFPVIVLLVAKVVRAGKYDAVKAEPYECGVKATSFALENTVAEDCEQCYACILSCPQVDTNIKDYIVDEKVVEVIPQSKAMKLLDNYFMVVVALIFGIIIGVFLTR